MLAIPGPEEILLGAALRQIRNIGIGIKITSKFEKIFSELWGKVGDISKQGKWTKEVIERNVPGADGASSRHIIEKLNGKTKSVTHQVTKEGKVIHQHQTHIGENGTQREFPDEWIEYPKVPLDEL